MNSQYRDQALFGVDQNYFYRFDLFDFIRFRDFPMRSLLKIITASAKSELTLNKWVSFVESLTPRQILALQSGRARRIEMDMSLADLLPYTILWKVAGRQFLNEKQQSTVHVRVRDLSDSDKTLVRHFLQYSARDPDLFESFRHSTHDSTHLSTWIKIVPPGKDGDDHPQAILFTPNPGRLYIKSLGSYPFAK